MDVEKLVARWAFGSVRPDPVSDPLRLAHRTQFHFRARFRSKDWCPSLFPSMRLLGISLWVDKRRINSSGVLLGRKVESPPMKDGRLQAGSRGARCSYMGRKDNAQRNRWIPLLHESRTREVERSILPGKMVYRGAVLGSRSKPRHGRLLIFGGHATTCQSNCTRHEGKLALEMRVWRQKGETQSGGNKWTPKPRVDKRTETSQWAVDVVPGSQLGSDDEIWGSIDGQLLEAHLQLYRETIARRSSFLIAGCQFVQKKKWRKSDCLSLR